MVNSKGGAEERNHQGNGEIQEVCRGKKQEVS